MSRSISESTAPRRLLVGMAALGLSIAGCAGKQTPADRISSEGESLFNGRVSPDINCYKCHNGDGSGTWRGPDLAKRVPKLTDQKIVTTIMEGPGFMPSFKGKVSDAQAQEIARWLHGRFPLAAAPSPVRSKADADGRCGKGREVSHVYGSGSLHRQGYRRRDRVLLPAARAASLDALGVRMRSAFEQPLTNRTAA